MRAYRLILQAALFTAAAITALCTHPQEARAQPYDEVIIWDSTTGKPWDEGLARQRLGLLDADGKPQVDNDGNLVPMVSANGKKKAFDNKGGNGTKFEAAVLQLAANNGVLTIIVHGGRGFIELDGEDKAGFGVVGTGVKDCNGKGVPVLFSPTLVDGVANAKTNVDINLVVCYAGLATNFKASVAATLKEEIEASGRSKGSVSSVTATEVKAFVGLTGKYEELPGVTLTQQQEEELLDSLESFKARVESEQSIPLKDQYSALQAALDGGVGQDKVKAMISYYGKIDNARIKAPPPPTTYATVTADSIESEESNCDSCAVVVAIGALPPAPARLWQNKPNPFNPSTEIVFETDVAGRVQLAIYDVAGRRVRTLTDRHLPPGRYANSWDGRGENGMAVTSGVYFYRLSVGDRSLQKRMVLLK